MRHNQGPQQMQSVIRKAKAKVYSSSSNNNNQVNKGYGKMHKHLCVQKMQATQQYQRELAIENKGRAAVCMQMVSQIVPAAKRTMVCRHCSR